MEIKRYIFLVFKLGDYGLDDLDNIEDIKFGRFFALPFSMIKFFFRGSVHCSNTREYGLGMFYSRMHLCFTYTYTIILNTMVSK